MATTYQILSVRRGEFTADDGRKIKYAKVNAIDPSAPKIMDDEYKGAQILEFKAEYDCFGMFTEVPGIYEVEMHMIPVKGGVTAKIYAAKKVK